MIELN